MSGYRNLHREQVESTAIWDVETSPLLISKRGSDASLGYRIWTASADGLVRSYHVYEKSVEEKQQSSVLDASALSMNCTHVLVGPSQSYSHNNEGGDDDKSSTAAAALGCTQVSTARNYVGEDDAAGDLVVASLEMSGIVRIWTFSQDEDADLQQNTAASAETTKPKKVKPVQEFHVENATGTVLMLCPPRIWTAGNDLCVAVACLDGTIAQIATGIATPLRVDQTKEKEPSQAGTVLDRWGSRGSAIPLTMVNHPISPVVAVGRQDGLLDILTGSLQQNESSHNKYRRHRLRLPGHEVSTSSDANNGLAIRAISYSPDANMLCAGNDAGMLAVWDVSRPGNVPPALVHHVVHAHASWVLGIAALPDSRRWVTCGADRKVNVWKVDQFYQAVHTFESDQTVWTVAVHSNADNKAKVATRLAAGSETGGLQVFSLDG